MSRTVRRADWRRGREAEGDGLLNRYRGNPIVGSNPTVSASRRASAQEETAMNEFGNGFLLNALIGFALALLVSFAFVWYR